LKILFLHNRYELFGGEEQVLNSQVSLLRNEGHEVITFIKNSSDIDGLILGKQRAFFSALNNPIAIRELMKLIDLKKPDLVHIHNLYPFISPNVLPRIKKKGIPIVMSVHNYRMVCPTGLLFNKGAICQKCTSGVRELNAVLDNCGGTFLKSVGYAVRNYWTRKRKFFYDHVDVFLTVSDVQKTLLINMGLDADKCITLPNISQNMCSESFEHRFGKFIGYVGRISEEKGVDMFIELAKIFPQYEFKVAGNGGEIMGIYEDIENLTFVGFLSSSELSKFYKESIFLVFPSRCYETFGLSIIEANSYGKPVVSSEIGAPQELIIDGITGRFFQAGNQEGLVSTVKELICDREQIRTMGKNAAQHVRKRYDKSRYYQNLISVYSKLVEEYDGQ